MTNKTTPYVVLNINTTTITMNNHMAIIPVHIGRSIIDYVLWMEGHG
jgi:hypothetical protein